MKRRFLADIKRGQADAQPKKLPKKLAALLGRAKDGDVDLDDDDVCAVISEFLVANFVKENVKGVDALFDVAAEVKADDVTCFGFTFSDGLLPIVTAGATFTLEDKLNLDDEALVKWQEEHDMLTDAVNFFWRFDGFECVIADHDGASFGLDDGSADDDDA